MRITAAKQRQPGEKNGEGTRTERAKGKLQQRFRFRPMASFFNPRFEK